MEHLVGRDNAGPARARRHADHTHVTLIVASAIIPTEEARTPAVRDSRWTTPLNLPASNFFSTLHPMRAPVSLEAGGEVADAGAGDADREGEISIAVAARTLPFCGEG